MVPMLAEDPVELPLATTAFTDEPPLLTDTRIGEGGTLVIEGTGEGGRRYDVQGSFDLQDWVHVGQVIALGGEFTITDAKNTGHQEALTGVPGNRIFYRLVLQD